MNGLTGETLAIVAGLNGIAPWVLAAYAVRRGWRVNTTPEKKLPVPPAETSAGGAADAAPAPSAEQAAANGASAG